MQKTSLREKEMNDADMENNKYADMPEKLEICNKLIVDAHLFGDELETSCVSSSRLAPKDNAKRNRKKRKERESSEENPAQEEHRQKGECKICKPEFGESDWKIK